MKDNKSEAEQTNTRLNNKISTLNHKISALQAEIEENNSKIAKHKQEELNLLKKIEDLESELDKYQILTEKLKIEKNEIQFNLESETKKSQRLTQSLEESKSKVNDLEQIVAKLKDHLTALKKSNQTVNLRLRQVEEECRNIISKWSKEREKILEDNQRLEYISRERLAEVEKKSYENGKLLIKLCLAYAELERLS